MNKNYRSASIIAFFLTGLIVTLLFKVCFDNPRQREKENLLNDEKYIALLDYVEENEIEYDKAEAVLEENLTGIGSYVGSLGMCTICIIPYTIIRKLLNSAFRKSAIDYENDQFEPPPDM